MVAWLYRRCDRGRLCAAAPGRLLGLGVRQSQSRSGPGAQCAPLPPSPLCHLLASSPPSLQASIQRCSVLHSITPHVAVDVILPSPSQACNHVFERRQISKREGTILDKAHPAGGHPGVESTFLSSLRLRRATGPRERRTTRTEDGLAADAKDEGGDGTGKPPPDVRVVLHPDNGVACAVRLSTGVPLIYSPSLASAWSGVTLTPAHSAKLDGVLGM